MGTNQVKATYEYTVVSFHYKNKSPLKLIPTTRKVMRPAQTVINPELHLFGLMLPDQRAISNLTVGEKHVDQFGDHWKRVR